MRQEKTLKPIANFNLSGDGQCVLTSMANNEKAWTWGCNDFSDEEGGALEKLCMKFNNKGAADEFKAAFEAGVQYNKDVKDGKYEVQLWPVLLMSHYKINPSTSNKIKKTGSNKYDMVVRSISIENLTEKNNISNVLNIAYDNMNKEAGQRENMVVPQFD